MLKKKLKKCWKSSKNVEIAQFSTFFQHIFSDFFAFLNSPVNALFNGLWLQGYFLINGQAIDVLRPPKSYIWSPKLYRFKKLTHIYIWLKYKEHHFSNVGLNLSYIFYWLYSPNHAELCESWPKIKWGWGELFFNFLRNINNFDICPKVVKLPDCWCVKYRLSRFNIMFRKCDVPLWD